MTPTLPPPATPQISRATHAVRTIVAAGLVAGVLDLLYVIVLFALRDVGPGPILRGIAAGLVGRETAIKGGVPMAALGFALHFVIALGAAATFYAVSRKLRFLVEKPVVGGSLFGLGAWLFMNLVVLPLSANPPKTFPSGQWVAVLIAHFVCVGLPIAFIVRKLERRA